MAYDFSNLHWLDFEDLARDVIGARLGVQFEAFAPGPDGGIDGRHSQSGKSIVLQAKHYIGSGFSKLKSKMKEEFKKIARIAPERYILVTSTPLSDANKLTLMTLSSGIIKESADILGPQDVNTTLRLNPHIEKAHVKLWLGSTAVLSAVVRSASHTFSAITREEVERKVQIYATNPSLTAARARLDEHHVVIISGPPGVGKTTLAEMLSFAYLREGWDLIGIRNLEDGYAAIVDNRKQIFYFDDFLGKIALDSRSLASRDSELLKFVGRVSKSPNARFVLTTRAYILEEARRISEAMSDRKIEMSKFVLDVGIYTRRIRARILFNHLLWAGTPIEHVEALVTGGRVSEIVDHKNYNPRIVEWMTDPIRLREVSPRLYVDEFIGKLDNPEDLWDIAFRTHISEKCRHLLYCIFFDNESGVMLSPLRESFNSVHLVLCKKYGIGFGPADFDDAVRTLEGSFINIQDKHITFVNPSLRDYMAKITNNSEILIGLAAGANTARWARAVWRSGLEGAAPSDLARLAQSFLPVARRFPSFVSSGYGTQSDLDPADRIELLFLWWQNTAIKEFSSIALKIAENLKDGPTATDARWLVKTACVLANLPDIPHYEAIKIALEARIIHALQDDLSYDDLEGFTQNISDGYEYLSDNVRSYLKGAIIREVSEIERRVADMDSESEVQDHINVLEEVAQFAEVPRADLDRAIEISRRRMNWIERETDIADDPDFGDDKATEPNDVFGDDDLQALFQPLLLAREK